jgi:glycosyltransferase involved in cell wall biosynthesis
MVTMPTDNRERRPRVSIVVPAFNAERYLVATIESVLGQSIADWELALVDDGSTDSTLAIAQRYADRDTRIRVVHQANAGGGAARNRGLEEISPDAELIAFLDADDVYERDTLETLIRVLETQPEAVAAHGLARFIDGQGQCILVGEAEQWGRNRRTIGGVYPGVVPAGSPTTFAVLSFWCPIHTPGQGLIRRSEFDKIGSIDAATSVADWDMWLRLALHGDIAYTDKIVLNYRRHEGNMSGQWRQMASDMRYVRRKLMASSELSAEQRRIFSLATLYSPALLYLRFAKQYLEHGRVLDAARQIRHALVSYAHMLGWIFVPRQPRSRVEMP